MEYKNIYEEGIKAKKGDVEALQYILGFKEGYIKLMARGNKDCYQEVIEKVIKGIKNYDFKYV